MLLREPKRRLVFVRSTAVVPGLEVVDGAAVVVAVGVVAGRAVRGPDQRVALPVDRQCHWPRLGGHGLEGIEGTEAARVRLVDAEAARAELRELALGAGRLSALGQPEAAAPAAEAPLVRFHSSRDLQLAAGLCG